MFSYTDMILSVMQRVEVYNEIFNAISKEIQENSCSQTINRRGKDMYALCRNNVNRFFLEEETFRKHLSSHGEQEATKILLAGLDSYKEGIYFWLDAMNENCEVIDEIKYKRGINSAEYSFSLINQACKEACGGIESAHSVHKM
ncbi:hypothetical protein [Enterococcus sp. UD-01]|jgi:hypothetical protein|uniref:hypothetical protein n=1 Tax=Enterococcus sp. UD-01 TaxID=3373911 RepID=UPI003839C38C